MLDREKFDRVVPRVWAERVRQVRLKEAGRFPFTLDQPNLGQSQRFTKLVGEVGEVGTAIEWVEGTVYDVPAYVENRVDELKKELTQVAALAIAWLEGLES